MTTKPTGIAVTPLPHELMGRKKDITPKTGIRMLNITFWAFGWPSKVWLKFNRYKAKTT